MNLNLLRETRENTRINRPQALCLEVARVLLVDVVVADLVCGVHSTGSLLAIEQSCGLLQRQTPGLDDEDVAEHELEREPAAVHDVVLPGDVAESDRVDVLVEDEGERDDEVEDVETLGTEAVGKDLDGVGNDEGGERKTRE